MPKLKTVYTCSQCGYESARWFGKCNACGQWNTCVEDVVSAKPSAVASSLSSLSGNAEAARPRRVSEIPTAAEARIDMQCGELNRVLGGGLVPGSLVLIGGEPGIGKSTLILQTALRLKGLKVLYVSGEESASQIKLRADRIGAFSDNCYILSETSLDRTLTLAEQARPDVLVIDSIQTVSTDTVESSAGSLTQVRECAALLLKFAKRTGTPVFLVGHITKDGSIAGPKILEHIVDTVLQFEGDRQHLYRILRCVKNRFGSTSELGIFEMAQSGLREVENPSELLLSERQEEVSGVTVAAAIEGVRPLLVEVQALTGTATYGTPQRSTTGFDARRMNMLLAVLEKRAGFKVAQKDVFLNIAGGLRVSDTATDLAVICAILSANLDVAVSQRTALAGEVGLSGEIRPVGRIAQRVSEARKLGFGRIIIPRYNLKGLDTGTAGIEIKAASKVDEAFKILFR